MIRIAETELRELVGQPELGESARAAAWERLRALARRPTVSVAVCDDDSELGLAVTAWRESRAGHPASG